MRFIFIWCGSGKKDDKFALINSRGDFLIPFGEYEFQKDEYLRPNKKSVRPSSPFFLASKNGQNYMLSPEGKVLYQTAGMLERVGGDFSYAREAGAKKKMHTYISSKGQVFNIPYNTRSISDGIFIEKINKNEFVFRSINGQKLTEDTFNFLSDFREGLAVVGKIDDRGEMKFGFMNTEGSMVTPLKFTKPPGVFVNGYAKVLGADGTEMEHAFIDKNGKIVFEKKLTDKLRSEFLYHWNGYFVGNWDVADLEGNIKSIRSIAVNELKLDLNHYNLAAFWSRSVFTGDHRFRFSDRINKWGFIDLEKDIVVDAIFSDDFIPFHFDPVSGLAYAEMSLPIEDKSETQTIRKGYINEEGVFMLVFHEELSTW